MFLSVSYLHFHPREHEQTPPNSQFKRMLLFIGRGIAAYFSIFQLLKGQEMFCWILFVGLSCSTTFLPYACCVLCFLAALKSRTNTAEPAVQINVYFCGSAIISRWTFSCG
jgi:hypothetical protein